MWRHRCSALIEESHDTEAWGELRSALHAQDWHRVRDVLARTPPPLRQEMTRYAQDFWPDDAEHLPMLGKVFSGVYVGELPGHVHERLLAQDGEWSHYARWRERGHPLEMLVFESVDGWIYALIGELNQSEIWLEDVNGDLDDLVGLPLLEARVLRTPLRSEDADVPVGRGFERYTFYHFATHKGRVTLRWYGTSSGWYSTDVKLLELEPQQPPRLHEQDWEDLY